MRTAENPSRFSLQASVNILHTLLFLFSRLSAQNLICKNYSTNNSLWLFLGSADHCSPAQMNNSACLPDTSLLVLTLQFKINTARIKVLIISPWVLTPYYLLSNSGLHHLSCPSGSWFRYHSHLCALSFELHLNLADFSPVQYLKAFRIYLQSLNSPRFSASPSLRCTTTWFSLWSVT